MSSTPDELRPHWGGLREDTVASITALRSLISRASGADEGFGDFGGSEPRSDVRGPVVTPGETAGTPITPEVLQELIAAYEAGASLATIAAERKISKQSVRRFLVEAGVRIRQQGLSDEQAGEVVQRYLKGYSGREVAAEFGVGTATVWRTLKEAGVPSRPRTRRKRADR